MSNIDISDCSTAWAAVHEHTKSSEPDYTVRTPTLALSRGTILGNSDLLGYAAAVIQATRKLLNCISGVSLVDKIYHVNPSDKHYFLVSLVPFESPGSDHIWLAAVWVRQDSDKLLQAAQDEHVNGDSHGRDIIPVNIGRMLEKAQHRAVFKSVVIGGSEASLWSL